MRISFNVVFDPAAEQTVQQLKQEVRNAGVPVQAVYRPHITLAVYIVSDPLLYEGAVTTLAQRQEPFPVQLDVLGIFPEYNVVFLAPRMSATLFSLHRAALEELEIVDGSSLVSSHLLPDQWVPHVTVAGTLDSEQLLTTVQVCHRYWQAMHAQAIGITMRLLPAATDYRFYPFSRPRSPVSGLPSPVPDL